MTKILFIADTHIGSTTWGVPSEQYDAPFREAVDYAIANGVSEFIIAGDTHNKRNPTMEEHRRLHLLLMPLVDEGIDILKITGNHDYGATFDAAPSTLFAPGVTVAGKAASFLEHGIQIVTLPWPRPVDYGIDASLDLEQQIHETRKAVMTRLHEICSALDPTRPAVLTGHAMVSYSAQRVHVEGLNQHEEPVAEDLTLGPSMPRDPGLLLGKDIVLNFDELCNLPNIKSNVLLGHVHDAGAKGYIGSTQPTDFADTAPKTFTVLAFIDGTNYVAGWEDIPYETSLRVDELNLDEQSIHENPHMIGAPKVDIRRIKVTVPQDSTLSENDVREIFDGKQDRLIVEITRERIERTRIVTDVPVAQMGAAEALAEWFMANNIEPEVAGRANALFLALEAE